MLIAALVCIALSFAASIWALVIIFKRSIVGGLLSLFLGLPVLYYLVTGWGKEGQDIKKPFFLSIVLWIAAAAIILSSGISLMDDGPEERAAPPAQSTPTQAAPKMREMPKPAAALPEPAKPAATPVSAPAPAPVVAPAPVAPVPVVSPAPLVSPAPVAAPAPVKRAEPARAATPRPVVPERPKPAPTPCVYKPVMTDEDMAKCR